MRYLISLMIFCFSITSAHAQDAQKTEPVEAIEKQDQTSSNDKKKPSKFSDYMAISLEELLQVELPKAVASSRKEELIDLAPNVMYVVTAEEIKRRGYRNLYELLGFIPGFFTSYKPLEPILQVRGIAPNENNKVTFMINGHRINNVNESSDTIWPNNLASLERVEIIVGPGSVLYGSDSLAATVNMITKDIDGAEVMVSYGQNAFDGANDSIADALERGHSYTVTAIGGKKISDTRKIMASATFAQDYGFESEAFMRHSGERIGPEGRDMFSRRLGIIRPSYMLISHGQWDDWQIQFTSINQTIPEYSQNREADELAKNEQVHASRYNYQDSMVATNNKEWTEKLSTVFKISYDNKRMIRTIDEGCLGCGGTLDTHQKLYKGEVGLRLKADQHYFQAGFQASLENNRHNYTISNWDPSADYEQNPDDQGTAQSILDQYNHGLFGLYISEEYSPIERLTLIGALRVDNSTLTKKRQAFYSPRLAIVSMPLQNWVVKGMFNIATKYPNPWESSANKVWNSDRGADWATDFGAAKRPERMTAYELQSILYIKKIRFAANFYYQELKDFIAWANGFTNAGDFSGLGAEFQLDIPVHEKVDVWLNGGYQRAEFDSEQDRDTADWDHGQVENPDGEMNAVPMITLNVGADAEVYKDVFVTTSFRYFTKQVVRSFNIPDVLIDDWDTYLASEEADYHWDYVNNVLYWNLGVLWKNVGLQGLDLRVTGRNVLNNRKRVSVQYANGEYQPQGFMIDFAAYYKF